MRAPSRILAVAALIGPGSAGAQRADSGGVPPRRWLPPVASLLVPGTGQLVTRRDRGVVYLAVELLVLSRFIQYSREGRREAGRFRSLAFEVARRTFSPDRRDTVFEYYETMERFAQSGAFDRDTGAAFVPESDPATYNGSVWLLARRTFWADPSAPPDPASPEFHRALGFYQARAVGPDFVWSWHDHSLEHQVFRETIHSSDNAFRRAQNQLGLLLANHVASAVDALVSSRLAAATKRPAALETTLGPKSARLGVTFRF